MARRNFYEIIKNIRTNITKEYSRINELFESTDSGQSVRDMIEDAFFMFPKSFRGRTISLDDFDETYGFSKRMFIGEVSLEEFLLRCEYIINLCIQLNKVYSSYINDDDRYSKQLVRIGETVNITYFTKNHSTIDIFDARNGHDDRIIEFHDIRHLSFNCSQATGKNQKSIVSELY